MPTLDVLNEALHSGPKPLGASLLSILRMDAATVT